MKALFSFEFFKSNSYPLHPAYSQLVPWRTDGIPAGRRFPGSPPLPDRRRPRWRREKGYRTCRWTGGPSECVFAAAPRSRRTRGWHSGTRIVPSTRPTTPTKRNACGWKRRRVSPLDELSATLQSRDSAIYLHRHRIAEERKLFQQTDC